MTRERLARNPWFRRGASAAAAAAAAVSILVACRRFDVSALLEAAPAWVIAALALNSASMLLRAFAWLGTLRGALPGAAISAGSVVRATMIGVLGSAVVPARAGEALRSWLVARRLKRSGALATVVGTVLSLTIINLAALALLSLLALPGALLGHGSAAMVAAFAWPATLAGAIVVAARLLRRGRFARQVAALRGGLAVFRQWRRGLRITTLQLGAWALQTLAAYALLLALGLHVAAPLATAAAILVAVNVTAAVPITPSNIGIFQAACVGVLAGAGVAPGPALAYGLLLQGTELATALVLGLPAAATELAVGAAES